MIKSLLIANRGEIAIRICRTAKRMGIKTYVIRTVKEPNAVYLDFADQVLDFPETDGTTPEFLDIENLVKLAVDNKIQALHPGYGYLSENAEFAQKCTDAGVKFVGPPAKLIKDMGDKIIAKEIAAKNGVPMLQGSEGSVKDVKEGVKIAKKIGYPVIIKAASGGGGRGMRIVHKQSEMERMFHAASSEAQSAFGDPSVFIEKYLENPKHIEFQVVADAHGNVVHLGERECSVQRKHQKLLEEAPSSGIDAALRSKMARVAVKLAKGAGYESLGTVEFLLDKNKNFYFMEMNTRIQVEHPITEEITGLDLVELQLRIASGEKLPIKQSDVKLDGWAIECRINAEDVQADFTPSMGTIKQLRLPQGDNIRIDTGIVPGSEITPWFDSMIAKLIVHGKDRKQAIERALSALERFHIKGVKTSIPFCKAVLHNEAFRSGDFDTSFIETKLESLVYREPDEELMAAMLALYQYTHETVPDVGPETGIDPWVLNRRIRNL
ncbi:acetyl/propionyl/methylcrotonyl-CoA carboxylase subunit alpha [uncultured Rikenella sp.]|uniref:acetyl-CoA carboxylase biotin carboxylase subunit n=1 Tax=uncultured Rikenella sp. TaxID=368003 RepID=UPI0026238BC5|nr:acetyl-CoA carboxylase biotin carboxylase subunit [uncultured Rikenella sp.]